jgi:hypothetical protein
MKSRSQDPTTNGPYVSSLDTALRAPRLDLENLRNGMEIVEPANTTQLKFST